MVNADYTHIHVCRLYTLHDQTLKYKIIFSIHCYSLKILVKPAAYICSLPVKILDLMKVSMKIILFIFAWSHLTECGFKFLPELFPTILRFRNSSPRIFPQYCCLKNCSQMFSPYRVFEIPLEVLLNSMEALAVKKKCGH